MLKIISTISHQANCDDILTLPFATRQKSRFKAQLDSGKEVGIFLERGKILRDGDLLQTANGLIIRLASAEEKLSCVSCASPLLLAKLCYHLGNRHVSLQVEVDHIYYLQDSVLDDMVIGLGAHVTHVLRSFEPEEGAYSAAHRHDA